MNIYTNTKKSKKFILVLVLLMLFNFCYPKQVKAFDFLGNVSSFFFLCESGIINFLNDIFCDEEHEFKLTDPNHSQVLFTAENIIKGKFLLFDANIFKEIGDGDYYDKFEWLIGSDGDYVGETPGDYPEGAKVTLRNIISGWYYNLLNFAIVALLSVLVYVGIRMITSSISQDKAKYKTMLKDWVVAMCLLIAMHYIMIGVLNLTTMVTKAIGTSGDGGSHTSRIMSIIYNINDNQNDAFWSDKCDGEDYEGTGHNFDKVEGCRYHMLDENGEEKHYTISDAFAYEIFLIALIFITFLFAWKYLRREFTIIFLILLGPISCITYPIDKISDGKAQAFNKWLTEFIYNVLIQPFHLLLYLVLCGSAVELANNNLLYGLACLAMLVPAEKFVKEMFGFKDKLGSPLGAMATGALGSQLLSKMKGGVSKGTSGSGGENNNSTPDRIKDKSPDLSQISGSDSQPVNTADGDPTNTADGDPANIGDGDPANTGDGDPANTGDGDPANIGDGDPANIGDGDPANTADGDPANIGDGDPANIGDGDPANTGDGDPANIGDGDPANIGDGDPANTADGDPANTGDGDPANTGDGDPANQEKPKRTIKGIAKTLINRHSLRAAEKYGTTDRKQRWISRGKKVGKLALKTAGGLTGAAVGGAIGLMSGKGFIAGAAAGSALGGKLYNVAEKAANVASDYRDAFRTPEQRQEHAKKLALNDFMTNKKQRDNAVLDFREKNGRDPSANELNNEMKDRFELYRYGMSDEAIDEGISKYQNSYVQDLEKQAENAGINTETLKEEAGGNDNLDSQKYRESLEKNLVDKLGNQKGNQAIQKAKDSASNKTALASQLANRYKGKFEKESEMKGALNALTDRFVKSGVKDRAKAESMARDVLTEAADMKDETIQLPPIKIPETFEGNMLKASGVNKPTKQQMQRVVNVRQELESAGFDESAILEISKGLNFGEGETAQIELETKVNTYIDYKNNTKAMDKVKEFLGNSASSSEINQEIIERVEIGETFGLENQNQIEAIREMENELAKGDRNKIAEYRKLGQKAKINGGKVSKKDRDILSKDEIAIAESYSQVEVKD